MNNKKIKLAVIFQRFGPYHHARLKALSAHCELLGIECSEKDNTYAWDIITGETVFKRVRLVQNCDIEDLDKRSVKILVRECLVNLQPEVVAVSGWSMNYSIAAMQWCVENSVPIIMMSDSTYYDYPRIIWKEYIKKQILRIISSAIVAGRDHKDYLVKLGVPVNRIFLGYDVIDNQYFTKMSGEARKNKNDLRIKYYLPERYFLTSNRFIPKKNITRLIDAYNKYYKLQGNKAWHLVILGDGELKEELQAQVSGASLESYIHFAGFKQYDQLPVYYALATAYIHASTTEQWGLVVNEAMASGLPVLISNRCGCARDLVKHGVNGFTFDPFNTEQITQTMLKITFMDKADLVEMGKQSLEIVSHWDVERFADGMMQAANIAIQSPLPKKSFLSSLALRFAV